MNSGRIEPICLKGMDAVNFIRSLYFPSEKERFEYEKRREDLGNIVENTPTEYKETMTVKSDLYEQRVREIRGSI